MASTLYLVDTAHTGTMPGGFAGTAKQLSLDVRGDGANSSTDNTVASLATFGNVQPFGQNSGQNLSTGFPTAGIAWVSNPLEAITINTSTDYVVRGLESGAMANYGLCLVVYKLASDGTATRLAGLSSATEIGTAESVRTLTDGAPSYSISAGDRFCVVPCYGPSSGGTTASGFTASGFWDGTTNGGTGDSKVVIASQTLTEQAAGPTPSLVWQPARPTNYLR